MENYKRYKEVEQAIYIALPLMLNERQTLDWQDGMEDKIEALDKAIRELQMFVESGK